MPCSVKKKKKGGGEGTVSANSIDSGQPMYSTQADPGQNVLQIVQFSVCQGTRLAHNLAACRVKDQSSIFTCHVRGLI